MSGGVPREGGSAITGPRVPFPYPLPAMHHSVLCQTSSPDDAKSLREHFPCGAHHTVLTVFNAFQQVHWAMVSDSGLEIQSPSESGKGTQSQVGFSILPRSLDPAHGHDS